MCDESGHEFTRRELVVAIPVGRVALAIRRHAIEMEIGKRRKAFRLLVVECRVRVAAGEPAPRTVQVIRLPSVDDDVGNAAPQFVHDAAPARPLRVRARAWVAEERMVKRISADARSIVERDESLDEMVLPAPNPQARVLFVARGDEPVRIACERQHGIYVR